MALDWATIGIAATVATAFATGISTAVTIWWRAMDRQEAEWSVRVDTETEPAVQARNDGSYFAHRPRVGLVFQNIGDGTAHQVRVGGSSLREEPALAEADVQYLEVGPGRFPQRVALHAPLPIVRAGESFYARVRTEFEVWDTATVVVSWWPPPTRRKKRWIFWSRQGTQEFRLADLVSPPDGKG